MDVTRDERERDLRRTSRCCETRGIAARRSDAFVVAAALRPRRHDRGLRARATARCAWSRWPSATTGAPSRRMTAPCWRSRPMPAPTGFITGGDDGKFRRIAPDGTVTRIADFGIEMGGAGRQPSGEQGQAACSPAPSASACICSTQAGEKLKELRIPSTRHRPRLRCQGQARRRLALQRRDAVVRRRQDGHAAQAGMEGQPHRRSPSIPTATRW